jgi:hypothetical protein
VAQLPGEKERIPMRFRYSTLVCPLAVCCLALACLPGCGKKKATVKGKVTWMKTTPLTAGTIAFVAKDGRTGSSNINSKGEYTVTDAPIGDVTITVTTPPAPMGGMKMDKPPPGMSMPENMRPPGDPGGGQAVRIVPAPKQYGDKDKSPLHFTVQPGTQEHDVDLTP